MNLVKTHDYCIVKQIPCKCTYIYKPKWN